MDSKIKFDLSATGPGLTAIVRLDGQVIWQGQPISDPTEIIVGFDDGQDGGHLLEVEMQGKLRQHTRIDTQGLILEDRLIQIRNFTVDDIALGHTLTEISEYHHDHNGYSDRQIDRFYGDMGCNGIVRIPFTTPIYLWLLENL